MGSDGYPVAGVDYPRNYHELLAWFPDDAACLGYLAVAVGRWVGVPVLRDGRRRVLADGRRSASLLGVPA